MAAPRKDNVREKIIDAASELLEEKAYNNISLNDIAERAGISKGTLYYHYKTKEDLLFDVADTYFTRQYEELEIWTDNPKKDTSFHRLFKYILERDVYEPAIRFRLLYAAMEGNDSLKEKLIDRYRLFQTAISKKIGERVQNLDPDFLAWTSLLLSDGIIVQSALNNKDFDPQAYIEQADRFITRLSPEFRKN